MKVSWSKSVISVLILGCCILSRGETVLVVTATNASPRVAFGAAKLVDALKDDKIDAKITQSDNAPGHRIYLDRPHDARLDSEGFRIDSTHTDLVVSSHDDSGLLYGCLDL